MSGISENSSSNSAQPISAELVLPVAADDILDETSPVLDATIVESDTPSSRSWVFRIVDWISWLATQTFGIASLILILAIVANVPLVQLIAFGYLLAVSGRIAQSGRIRDGFVDLDKAAKIGSIFIGTSLVLLPARVLSYLHQEAYLIAPDGNQTQALKISLVAVIALGVPHVMAAWFCGGRLRYFVWPLIAPFSLGLWAVKKCAGSATFKPAIEVVSGWISPHLADDLVTAKPITDWFLPAILWKNLRNGTLIGQASDNLWGFVMGLKLGYYFKLGLLGFLGSFAWLALPTLLMFRAIGYDDGLAIACGLIGIVLATAVFALLPFLQTRFAETGKFRSFFELGSVLHRFGRAPLLHLLSLFVLLLLALPLFVFKIEEIPSELLWTLSLVFVTFSLPGRCLTGWAVGRGSRRANKRAWWYRWPLAMMVPVVSFVFAFLFFFSPFVAWHGGYSLFENHAFLLPAPFWVSYFV